ncbi:ace1 transcription factor [Moniliophthora roreri]|nr:ace1 transcription factor [Moniliophthora roreri]
MVLVNNKKFACESCIKGHRSSACAHTDRPLFEIKKKGRPISQCEKCRSLRQSRKMHSKCNCADKDITKPAVVPLPASAGAKAKRFIPVVPSLPNGLKDLQTSSQTVVTLPDARQRVNTLLKHCSCKDLGKCRCRKSKHAPLSFTDPTLATLAKAAALCETSRVPPHCCSSPSQPPPSKRPKHKHVESPSPLELPPLLFSDSSFPESPTTVPDFGVMPPLSEISSFAGSGCTCGVECNCPGCIEHRGPENVDTSVGSCADGCGTCVDNRHGIALQGQESVSIIDRFFARAAALPAPPVNRKMGVGVQLDPMNVMVYPKTAIETKERGIPFGLITVPKLECCGGKCGCPDGQCGCGKSCNGCCADHVHGKAHAPGRCGCGKNCDGRCVKHVHEKAETQTAQGVCCAPSEPIPAPMVVRNCCSGKVTT